MREGDILLSDLQTPLKLDRGKVWYKHVTGVGSWHIPSFIRIGQGVPILEGGRWGWGWGGWTFLAGNNFWEDGVTDKRTLLLGFKRLDDGKYWTLQRNQTYNDAGKSYNKTLHSTLHKIQNWFLQIQNLLSKSTQLLIPQSLICLRNVYQNSAIFNVYKGFYKGFSEGRERQIFLFLMCLCTKRTKN